MFYLSRSTLAAMFGKITAVLGVIQVLFYLSVLSLYAQSLYSEVQYTTEKMTENEGDLLDYEEDEQETGEQNGVPEGNAIDGKKEVKGNYVSIHSSGFRDLLLKPELLRAIVDCGFEHPSEGK